MTWLGNGVGARRALGWSLLVGNLVMVLVFMGAAGATWQARRALEGVALGACAEAATIEVGVAHLQLPSDPDAVGFVGDDTIRFEVRDPEDQRYVLTCRFEEPHPDADWLTVRSVEVAAP